MAVFTALTRDDAAGLLQRYDLGTLLDLQGIGTGIDNTNYFLTTTAGSYVLTLFERLTRRQLPFYLELMRHLARRGLPVPDPLDARDGTMLPELKGKPAVIVTRRPGKAVVDPSGEDCKMVGRFLAAAHRAAVDFPSFQPPLLGIGWWKSVLPRLEPFLADDEYLELAEEVVFQDTFHRSADFEALGAGPIHADLFRDNVLFDGAAIGGVIDFYFAGNTIWLFDLAVAVNDWCVQADGYTLDPERTGALLGAYDAERRLTADEAKNWRTVLRAAALRFWISRLHDLHLPRAAHVLRPHDPARFGLMLRDRIRAPDVPWLA